MKPSVNKVVDDLTAWQKNQPAKTPDAAPAKLKNADKSTRNISSLQ
jgi:hypothetical protein